MYVFLPSTIPGLADVLATGTADGTTAFAADPRPGADDEEAGYDAMYAAAEASLELLAADPDAPRRRVVLAAVMPDQVVERRGGAGPNVVRVSVTQPVSYKKLASAHVDDEAAADDIAAGDAEDHELLWFAVQELRHLVGEDGA
ncbi:DUF6912 family protein [Nocardiopsis sp. NRRL B-16309]|uniref:DUF6912 family protein n=1 Tax=Nocardiopsis sp. NRRL B-16309 TaxID=1519494 RepID=UPI0006AEEB6A|nr:hypothetical protein [Nocardiopsis sp. NRRL B-16309]KOX22227.1 hypothetical protein ADL05_04445 [Nocardiopsis sp. NRRL B-16309]